MARKDAEPLPLPLPAGRFVRTLLDWYRRHRREMPWRGEADSYRVWLSEVMLQQTRVEAVRPYYERFIGRFPTVEALAEAEESDVLAQWAGLGYYSRARNLHRAARIVCEEFGGRFPETMEEARSLPGVGRYTAGAVLSIAYGQPQPVLDGNIRRFLTRFLCLDGERSPDGRLWRLLEELVAHPEAAPRASDFNQALMEFGSQVCVPRTPRCGECPLSGSCRALAAGLQADLPRPKKVREPVRLHFLVALIWRDSELLLRRNDEGPFLKGFWEPPRLEGDDPAGFAMRVRKRWGVRLEVAGELPTLRHQITHHQLELKLLRCRLREGAMPDGWQWADPAERRLPLPAYVRKLSDPDSVRGSLPSEFSR